MNLRQDTWRIDDTPEGWTLWWRPPQTSGLALSPALVNVIPGWLSSRWGAVGVCVVLGLVCAVVERAGHLGRFRNEWRVAVGVALPIVALLLRLYARNETHLNEEHVVHVRLGFVHTNAGVFPVECLESLRLCRMGARTGRALLKFRGKVVTETDFLPFPGLSHPVAEQLLEAVRTRLASGRLT